MSDNNEHTESVSRMVTVEVTGPPSWDSHEYDPAQMVEDELSGTALYAEDDDGDEIELGIGAVGEIDPALIDDGIRYRRMPEDVRARFWRLQRDDPDYLNQVILTAAIRHTIYRELAERDRQVDVVVGEAVK